jgi:hypothetical protein
MAVPATPRDDAKFNSLGLVGAAVLGLTDPAYNVDASLQFIPNMDGFPNGRRLEDDVTRIELQAVGGIVLGAIGLPYDDYDGANLASPALLGVLGYSTNVNGNDTTLKSAFPYVQTPWPGDCQCAGLVTDYTQPEILEVQAQSMLGLSSRQMFVMSAPNPTSGSTTIRYRVETTSRVGIEVYNLRGNKIKTLVNQSQEPGVYSVNLSLSNLASGVYLVKAVKNGVLLQTIRVIKN